MLLLVGDDWAEDHHDIELMDADGRRLVKARLPEGAAGMARLHALIAEHAGDLDVEDVEVRVGIETDRGPWVRALIAAGFTVFVINPMSVDRLRDRYRVSGAKSDPADAHVLADVVRTDAHRLRTVAGDSAQVEGIKALARAHKVLIWDRTRHTQRLRHGLREYFPAALAAFEDLDAPDVLELLGRAPDPDNAKRLSFKQICGALRRARRRDVETKAAAIQAALRCEQLGRPPVVTLAYAATTRATIAILATLNEQITGLQGEVEAHFGRHPDAEIVLSQPGIGAVLGARVLGEFGDDHARYASAKARKNVAGTSPLTVRSGKKKTVRTRHVHNDWLVDALMMQAFVALRTSPGARAYYDQQRARGLGHNAALRQLANRLVGILHGCLKTRTTYDEHTAWAHHTNINNAAA
jgi:transposase